MKQNKLLNALQQRLMNLINEGVDLFVNSRPALMIKQANWERMYGRELKYPTEEQVEALVQQNKKELLKTLDAIEDLVNWAEQTNFFEPKQTSLLESTKTPLKTHVDDELDAQEKAVLAILDK